VQQSVELVTFSVTENNTTSDENNAAINNEITENAPDIDLKLREELNNELQRIHCLGQSAPDNNEIYEKAMSRLLSRLKTVKTPGQASSLMLALSASGHSYTRRCGRINVQPGAITRRRPGVTRGCKRMKGGRPKSAEPPAKKAKRAAKLPRKLCASIRANKSHVAKH